MPGPSGKQRKAQLQLKRAIKRGDTQKPESLPASKRNKFRPLTKPGHTLEARQAADQAAKAARKLQSAFVKLDRGFLEETRRLAGSIVLRRPIPRDPGPGDRALKDEWMSTAEDVAGVELGRLSVPRRPKWKYKMTKEEVDANEQGHFRKWLSQQDTIVDRWQTSLVADHGNADDSETREMPHPPTHFERNLEVWRQLWRVTEISQILLVLLDSRCPPLHLPPSLATYLNIPTSPSQTAAGTTEPTSAQSTSRRKKSLSVESNAPRIVLVLTKVDISGPARTASWTSFLNAYYPGVPVVAVEAYAPLATGSNSQGRIRYEPCLPGTFRETLVGTLREVHAQMLQPPEWITAPRAGESERERAQRVGQWRPRIRREVDWEGVLRARGRMVGKAIGGAAVPRGAEEVGHDEGDQNEKADDTQEWKEPEFLTVGLIGESQSVASPSMRLFIFIVGQPNVGKSSLLNAVFGTTRVRASRTPGKTKHFQTLFWTSDVRLVDCPGLVMPSFVPMDVQVLSGVLPISRISAIPFCVHQLARLLPLERILGLTHPSLSTSTAFAMSAPNADKRTWRPGQHVLTQTKVQSNEPKWTANDIMIAYAEKKGWVTAKAGRPDIHRAGNASECFSVLFLHACVFSCGLVVLRLVAEGKIPWAFWPPGSPSSVIDTDGEGGDGIWLKDGIEEVSSGEEDMKARIRIKRAASDLSDAEEGEDEGGYREAEKADIGRRGNAGRFGALSIDDNA
ncbi:P-loop containing nucleoside triphosphate hydrolase protein [Gyrodon lividus]|nr:P-loop containing nucleoside triphosphate hydrolase protein [Gyrodon lividus]